MLIYTTIALVDYSNILSEKKTFIVNFERSHGGNRLLDQSALRYLTYHLATAFQPPFLKPYYAILFIQ